MLYSFDPLEPFAICESYVPSFVETIRTGKPVGRFFVAEHDRPKTCLISDDGSKYSVGSDQAKSASSSGRKMLAVVPIWGTLSPDGRYWGTATAELARQIKSLINDSQIGAIVLNIDSPGGTVTGTQEAADIIRSLRNQKPIVASVNSFMASAAAWIGTAATEVAITPSGDAGSIGVISMYADMSQMYQDAGIKVSVMRQPSKKARFSGVEPMTDEMAATMNQRISESYDLFKRAMADNRGTRIDSVESKFGGGEMQSSKEALASGLVDRIATFDEVLTGLFGKMEAKSRSSMKAAHDAAERKLRLVTAGF